MRFSDLAPRNKRIVSSWKSFTSFKYFRLSVVGSTPEQQINKQMCNNRLIDLPSSEEKRGKHKHSSGKYLQIKRISIPSTGEAGNCTFPNYLLIQKFVFSETNIQYPRSKILSESPVLRLSGYPTWVTLNTKLDPVNNYFFFVFQLLLFRLVLLNWITFHRD